MFVLFIFVFFLWPGVYLEISLLPIVINFFIFFIFLFCLYVFMVAVKHKLSTACPQHFLVYNYILQECLLYNKNVGALGLFDC